MRDPHDASRRTAVRAAAPIAGIFVGGRATRMGGAPKGLLVAPSGETIIRRWQRLFGALGIEAVLVGKHEAYVDLGMESLVDDPPGIGPLGGMLALLERGRESDVIAVGGDMPYVSSELLAKLVDFASSAPVVAPRRSTLWEPLFARYTPALSLTLARRRVADGLTSLQGLLDDLGAERLPLTEIEHDQLRDWDTPEDVSKVR